MKSLMKNLLLRSLIIIIVIYIIFIIVAIVQFQNWNVNFLQLFKISLSGSMPVILISIISQIISAKGYPLNQVFSSQKSIEMIVPNKNPKEFLDFVRNEISILKNWELVAYSELELSLCYKTGLLNNWLIDINAVKIIDGLKLNIKSKSKSFLLFAGNKNIQNIKEIQKIIEIYNEK